MAKGHSKQKQVYYSQIAHYHYSNDNGMKHWKGALDKYSEEEQRKGRIFYINYLILLFIAIGLSVYFFYKIGAFA